MLSPRIPKAIPLDILSEMYAGIFPRVSDRMPLEIWIPLEFIRFFRNFPVFFIGYFSVSISKIVTGIASFISAETSPGIMVRTPHGILSKIPPVIPGIPLGFFF